CTTIMIVVITPREYFNFW
nr:immunoglobulin heavy chain junction region [Macaca mulatta]MPN84373.1 immunoglobulin heavy chain junction region [Macaca mulatta]MPN84468.1 immunoglobulin heavy chain junction region [Macaca mulatta]MPN84556.1 immunoglobulin heavy chain junction region [Macaca mulatta]MPN84569.1 immunoglobulin heavy chain junction region [Macaca mulatta]